MSLRSTTEIEALAVKRIINRLRFLELGLQKQLSSFASDPFACSGETSCETGHEDYVRRVASLCRRQF